VTTFTTAHWAEPYPLTQLSSHAHTVQYIATIMCEAPHETGVHVINRSQKGAFPSHHGTV